MLIEWAESANEDLITLLKYLIDSGSNVLAEDTARRIIKVVERLRTFPHSGKIGLIENTRELVIPDLPHVIVYIADENIKIIRVLHTARQRR